METISTGSVSTGSDIECGWRVVHAAMTFLFPWENGNF